MSIFDLADELEIEVAETNLFNSNSTFFTEVIDTSDFDGGYMFTMSSENYADGTFILTLQDSPDNSVWTDVPAEKLNDPGGVGSITVSSLSGPGTLLGRIGAFSTNRYVRGKFVSSSVTTGADITILVYKVPEQTPA